jgi:recombination protein RecA
MSTKFAKNNSANNGAPAAAKDRPKKSEAAASPKNESQVLLANALGQIEKAFGKGSIMKLTEDGTLGVQGISTGALSLDLAMGGRGFPRGRVIELFGPESSGKTTLALHAIELSRHHRGRLGRGPRSEG